LIEGDRTLCKISVVGWVTTGKLQLAAVGLLIVTHRDKTIVFTRYYGFFCPYPLLIELGSTLI